MPNRDFSTREGLHCLENIAVRDMNVNDPLMRSQMEIDNVIRNRKKGDSCNKVTESRSTVLWKVNL